MNWREDAELPLVSVGVLNYNRKEELRVTLREILRSDYPALEVIVADNGSSDGSSEMVRTEFPDVKLYELEQNIGIAARNSILFEAKGKYTILYDDDSMPSTPTTIGKIVSFLERHADAAALCTNVVNYYSGQSETEGWEKYGVANVGEYYEGLFVHASGMSYRSECVRETHGFPEDFFWGLEEGDLTLQLVDKNLKIVYKPDVVTYHRNSPIHRDRPWAFLMRTRNGIWLFWKYFPLPLALWLTSRYVLKQAATAMAKPVYALSFFKGTYLGLRGIPIQWRKREPLSKEAVERTKQWQRQNVSLWPHAAAAQTPGKRPSRRPVRE